MITSAEIKICEGETQWISEFAIPLLTFYENNYGKADFKPCSYALL